MSKTDSKEIVNLPIFVILFCSLILLSKGHSNVIDAIKYEIIGFFILTLVNIPILWKNEVSALHFVFSKASLSFYSGLVFFSTAIKIYELLDNSSWIILAAGMIGIVLGLIFRTNYYFFGLKQSYETMLKVRKIDLEKGIWDVTKPEFRDFKNIDKRLASTVKKIGWTIYFAPALGVFVSKTLSGSIDDIFDLMIPIILSLVFFSASSLHIADLIFIFGINRMSNQKFRIRK